MNAGKRRKISPDAPKNPRKAREKPLLDGFLDARARLFLPSGPDQRVRRELARSTVERIARSAEYRPVISTQRQVIRLAQALPETRYAVLAEWIEQDVPASRILADYSGRYRYFRYAQPDSLPRRYVSGWLTIGPDANGDPGFQHWSHDYPPDVNEEPEHFGHVLKCGERVTLLGARRGVLRLAICKAFTGNRSKEVLQGVIASVRTHMRDPFSALFVLVHEDNAQALSELKPIQGSTEPPDRFFELSRGRNGNFITIA